MGSFAGHFLPGISFTMVGELIQNRMQCIYNIPRDKIFTTLNSTDSTELGKYPVRTCIIIANSRFHFSAARATQRFETDVALETEGGPLNGLRTVLHTL